MNTTSSIRHLDLVNLTIAFCNRVQGVEPVLAKLGYSVRSVEFSFQNTAGQSVKPDVILSCYSLNDALLFDCKSGKDPKIEQLKRYQGVIRDDLIERAFVQSSSRGDLSFDTTVFCVDEYFGPIKDAMESEGFVFPILALCSDSVKLKANHFGRQEVDIAFSNGVTVDRNAIPGEFVPFDDESEDWEIAERVIPKIIEYMHQNRAHFSISALASDVIRMWDMFFPSERSRFKKQISNVVRLAARNQLKGYIVFDKTVKSRMPEDVWQIASNPLRKQLGKRSKEWQKLQRLGREFVHMLRTGEKFPVQEELF